MEQRKGDNMDFLDFLKQRRSYRQYTGEPVEKELLDRIVEAGLLAPSGRNIKPEELIVVTDPKLLTQLSQCRKAGSQMLEGAGACIIVLGDEDKTDVWVEDCSNVILTMHYMASSLGLGSCWINRAKEEFASEEGKQLLKEWGIEGEYEGVGHCILGYADGPVPQAAPRKANRVFYVK